MHVVLTKIVPDDLKCTVNSLMVLSKRKKKLRAASHARWNIAHDEGKILLMCSEAILKQCSPI